MQLNSGLTSYAVAAWGVIVRGARALGASVAAFLKLPQVWLAGVVCAFAGYCLGFAVLKPKIIRLSETSETLHASNKALIGQRDKLQAEVARLSDALAKVPGGPPTPAVPVVRKPKALAAPVSADKPWWQVFP